MCLIRKHDDMELFDAYVDDGFSGTDFKRPGFKRMMADIEAGNVNCVIVKDLSRLGRDYIEAGRLIQKTFPAFHVRLITLTDNFDSQTAEFNIKSLIKRRYKEQKKYSQLWAGVYEDLKTGLITEGDFKNFSVIYEKKYEEIEDALHKQDKMQKQL